MKILRPAVPWKALPAVLLTFFVGCGPQRPSNSEIGTAVGTNLKNYFPTWWTGLSGVVDFRLTDVQLTSVTVTRWGVFNKDEKYWPILVRVVGRATVSPLFPEDAGKIATPIRQFDQVTEFRLRRDDYGRWVADQTQ